jgi:palmitoyltransferase
MDVGNALDSIKGRGCSCGTSDFYSRFASIRLVHAAARSGHAKILSMLNKHGCDMNARSGVFHRTPMSYAVRFKKLCVIDYLVSIGLDVNITYLSNGNTPLHEAIKLRHVDVVDKLLSAKSVKVNKVNAKGESPLLYAARYDVHEALLALLKAGADCNVQTKKGLQCSN